MVLGSNVQVVWEKFCRYWHVISSGSKRSHQVVLERIVPLWRATPTLGPGRRHLIRHGNERMRAVLPSVLGYRTRTPKS
jgi:hypothetical protein